MLSTETPYSAWRRMPETSSCGREKSESVLEAIAQRDHYSYLQDEELRSSARWLWRRVARPGQILDLDISYPKPMRKIEPLEDELACNNDVASLMRMRESGIRALTLSDECHDLRFRQLHSEMMEMVRKISEAAHPGWRSQCHNDRCALTGYVGRKLSLSFRVPRSLTDLRSPSF